MSEDGGGGSKVLAWLRLLRLPNVFSAFADVLLGWFASSAGDLRDPVLGLLLLSSGCIYLSGMVLNDVFDLEVDRRERPRRPLPAGTISVSTAWRTGLGLSLLGLLLAIAAGIFGRSPAPILVAAPLTALVWAYDARLKQTIFGPLAMGACRFLNVLLGMHVALGAWQPVWFALAAVFGCYIVGVTTFARHEADAAAGRGELILGLLLTAGALLIVWSLPGLATAAGFPQRIDLRWYLLAGVIWMLILRRAIPALISPSPARIQAGVQGFLQSYIMISAISVLVFRDPAAAIFLLALMLPQMLLARWVYAT